MAITNGDPKRGQVPENRNLALPRFTEMSLIFEVDFFHVQLFRADQGRDRRKGRRQRETKVGEVESALYVHNMVPNSNIPRGPDVATGASFLGNQRQEINLTWSEPIRLPTPQGMRTPDR